MPVGRKQSCESKFQLMEVGQLPVIPVGRRQWRETKVHVMDAGFSLVGGDWGGNPPL